MINIALGGEFIVQLTLSRAQLRGRRSTKSTGFAFSLLPTTAGAPPLVDKR